MLNYDMSFYKSLFESLDNNAVLREKDEKLGFIPVKCTREFARMMECEPEDFIRMEVNEPLCTVYPDDREEAEYLLNNGRTKEGGTHAVIRKTTAKGNVIWCDMHYAFFSDGGKEYAYCNYFDVTGLKERERQLQGSYDNVRKTLAGLAKDSLVSFRANLSRDTIEELMGKDVYDSDREQRSYNAFIRERTGLLPLDKDRQLFSRTFNPLNLISLYNKSADETGCSVSEILYSRRQSGEGSFVRFSADIRKDPMTGDIIVFGTESEYNAEKVNETLSGKVLAKQYDMITYIMDGQYGVVIGDASLISHGSIFPKERYGSYEDYIRTQVVPVASKELHNKDELLESLLPATIEKNVSISEPYSVNVAVELEGETYYKRFDFFVIDEETKFYMLLKSDYTELQKEQMDRNEQLKEALKEAEQASVAKTAFLSRMSHEIRTPMNAIIGLDTIALQEQGLTPELTDNLNKIGNSARYLLSLINDILDMSRIESGRMVIKNEEFSFKGMIEDINTIIYSQCQDKGLEYNCFTHGKIDDRYIGDSMKLKQVLINILGNAVKFTNAPGKVSMDVENIDNCDGFDKMRFTIKDTGIGMDKAYLPKIFEAFSQEDSSNTNKYGGSGLGMAISKNMINMMNGDITVDSEPGVGSTFVVEVSLKETEKDLSMDLDKIDIKPEDMHILVIDDDPIACQHAKIVLSEAGFDSETCLSMDEATELVSLHHARREDFNLILVDLRMPEHDGIETTKAIREIIGADVAIIILTAYNWTDVEDEAVEAGVDGFMRKPLYGNDVIKEFQRAHERRQIKYARSKREINIDGSRILLAEDVDINAHIMKKLLSMKGAEADIAVNGRIAFEMFKESEDGYYDAILMDIRMPEMDGLQATEAIRALDGDYAANIPIIAMTANAFDEDVQRSLQVGMNAHLSKPVEPQKLYETLDEFLNN